MDRGDYENLVFEIKDYLKANPQSESGWLVASYCYGHLGNFSGFSECLERAIELNAQQTPVLYACAFRELHREQLEEALAIYLELVEKDPHSLASQIIERARVDENMINAARSGRFQEFMPPLQLLPAATENKNRDSFARDLSAKNEPINKLNTDPSIEDAKVAAAIAAGNSTQKKYKPKQFFRYAFLFFLVAGIFILGFVLYNEIHKEKPKSPPDFSIANSASLIPIHSQKPLKIFSSREKLIKTFEEGKKALKNGNLNTARYLWNSVVHSNADFVSREKAQIYLNFIPQVDYSELKDNLSVSQILEEPVLRIGSYIICECEIITVKADRLSSIDNEKSANGVSLRLMSTEGKNDYMLEAFAENISFEKFTARFLETPKAASRKKNQSDRIMVYGQFRTLVGKQKLPYIEVIRLWQ